MLIVGRGNERSHALRNQPRSLKVPTIEALVQVETTLHRLSFMTFLLLGRLPIKLRAPTFANEVPMKTQLNIIIDSSSGKIDFLSTCKDAYNRIGDMTQRHNAMVEAIEQVFRDRTVKVKLHDLVSQVLVILKCEPHQLKSMDTSIRKFMRENSGSDSSKRWYRDRLGYCKMDPSK
jgi:hypothetical protein